METLKKEIHKATELYKHKHLNKAESLCKKLLNSYPKIVYLYNLLGLIFSEKKKIDEAIKCFEKGIEVSLKYKNEPKNKTEIIIELNNSEQIDRKRGFTSV